MMADFLLQFGITLVPFSAVVLIFAYEKMNGWAFWLMVIVSVAILYLGFYSLINAVKAANATESQRKKEMSLFYCFIKAMAIKQGVKEEEVLNDWEELNNGKSKRIKTKQEPNNKPK